MLPGNIRVWSIRDLLFRAGKQSSQLLVWGKSWFFSLTAKLKNQVEKNPFCLDHAGILFLLLNQIHCSIGCELIHPIPNGMVDLFRKEKERCTNILWSLRTAALAAWRSWYSYENLTDGAMIPWKPGICPALPCSGSHNSFENQECSLLCNAGCKWWESVDSGNVPILPSFPFLNALRTSFQPFHHSSHSISCTLAKSSQLKCVF